MPLTDPNIARVILNAPETTGLEDPSSNIRGMPPNFGEFVLPQIVTIQGLATTISRVYRPSDEALKDSYDNARFMRNDVGIMECVQARQRSVALLDWYLEPEDANDEAQKDLCTKLEAILNRIPRFMQLRENLLHAIWYGVYATQHRYQWATIGGEMRVYPTEWEPINGDKLVFRIDDGTHEYWHNQVGIRVGQTYRMPEKIGRRYHLEPTDRGMAYFLQPWERKLLAIHRHQVEDGAFEEPVDAGKVNGVGIRSVIYWEWYQKQQALAWLMEYLERSAFGIELWFYPEGNAEAKEKWQTAAKERIGAGRNMIFVPRPAGEDAMNYGVERIEPGLQGADVLRDIIEKFYGHRIKRYILGQTLTSEADATGLGSGLAELHLGTFLDIVKYDATNLEETITNDIVRPIQLFNFPESRGVLVRFRLKTESQDVKEKLESYERAWSMGARIREKDVLDIIGASIPNAEDRVLPAPGGGDAFKKIADGLQTHMQGKQQLEGNLADKLGVDKPPVGSGVEQAV